MVLYSGVWMYVARHAFVPVDIGCALSFTGRGQGPLTAKVDPDSPAQKAGLRRGDRLVAVNGKKVNTDTPYVLSDAWWNGRPGDGVELEVERPGEGRPLILRATFRAAPPRLTGDGGILRSSSVQILESFPILFLVVGLTVLFLRLEDRNAWLLAMVFAGFIAAAPIFVLNAVRPELRSFALAYRSVFNAFLMPLFYFFFAVFPARVSGLCRSYRPVLW